MFKHKDISKVRQIPDKPLKFALGFASWLSHDIDGFSFIFLSWPTFIPLFNPLFGWGSPRRTLEWSSVPSAAISDAACRKEGFGTAGFLVLINYILWRLLKWISQWTSLFLRLLFFRLDIRKCSDNFQKFSSNAEQGGQILCFHEKPAWEICPHLQHCSCSYCKSLKETLSTECPRK